MDLDGDNRELRERYDDLFVRSLEQHPGLTVPAFHASTVAAGRAEIGRPADEERQLLFFFTTTCEYCQAPIPAVRRLPASTLTELHEAGIEGWLMEELAAGYGASAWIPVC